MAKKSKIDLLSKKEKALLNDLIKSKCTIDDITTQLKEMNVDVSRSGVGRYKQKIENMQERMNQSRVITEALAEKLGSETTDNASRVSIELVRTVVMGIMTETAGEMNVKDLKLLTESVRNLETASKLSADRELKVREEVKKEMSAKAKEAANKVAKEAKTRGLTTEQVAMFRKEFLGLVG